QHSAGVIDVGSGFSFSVGLNSAASISSQKSMQMGSSAQAPVMSHSYVEPCPISGHNFGDISMGENINPHLGQRQGEGQAQGLNYISGGLDTHRQHSFLGNPGFLTVIPAQGTAGVAIKESTSWAGAVAGAGAGPGGGAGLMEGLT
ncbi:unnamed protein product, partial [Discosporangium mesarthrocarpum]